MRRSVIGEKSCRIGAGRFIAVARAAWINGDTGEVLGVVRHLEGIAGTISREKRNHQQRFAPALLLVIHGDIVDFNLRHIFVLFAFNNGH